MADIDPRDFGRLEGKVDAILITLQDMKTESASTHGDYESRIRKLERWRYGIPGGMLAALIALIVN